MGDALQIIGLIAVFFVGGYLFCAAAFAAVAFATRKQEIGAVIYGGIAFKIAAVVWVGLFLWFGPLTISFGVSP